MNKDFVVFDQELCIGCSKCVYDCLPRVIELVDGKAQFKYKERCMKCGHCGAICPVDAVEYHDDTYEVLIIDYDKDTYHIEPDRLEAFIRMKRSCRQYLTKPVEDLKLDKIINMGQISPTGGNRQPLNFVVVKSEEKLEDLRKITMETLGDIGKTMEGRYADVFQNMKQLYEETGYDRLFYKAPVLVVIHGDPQQSPSYMVDGGIAAGQMTLVAESLGLGSCYIGFLKTAVEHNDKIKEFLKIPSHHHVITNLILGYPDVSYYRGVPRLKNTIQYL